MPPAPPPQAAELAKLVAKLLGLRDDATDTGDIPSKLLQAASVSICLRHAGRSVFRHWQDGPNLKTNLRDALARARRDLPPETLAKLDCAELFIPLAKPKPFDPAMALRPAANRLRHRFGLSLRKGSRLARISPLELTSRNLSPTRAFEILAEKAGISPDSGDRSLINGESFLLDLTTLTGQNLQRGQPLVPQSDITRSTVQAMADEMTGWLVRQVGPTGQTTYKYWPSQGKYSDANNTIRQFMGSACLALAASRYPDPAVAAACRRNFTYNFATFYETRGRFGVINEFGKTKLGAAGVAITAILNLPDGAAWRAELENLHRFVDHMQNPDGSFRTFLDPPDRNDNQFFYPGEALLALAMLYQRSPDPAILDRLRRGFAYYRDFFRADRNPAFVPWHTQAYCLLHDITADPEVAAFVFEMNDWLLTMQETGTDPADITGDFFDPSRPGYGPPHASATGVYLEGLIEARRLALSLGDTSRAEAYRRSLLLGLRMLRQLQFRDATDMFYITKPDRVQGGLRTALFDNTIRIDNIQHGLMAIYRVLDRFGPDDYAL